MASRLYFEDFQPGQCRNLGTRTISAEEIIRFAREYDPQPFHVNQEAAARSNFGGLIASGWHTCAVVMRMMCDAYLLDAASMGSPGVDELRWLAPVRAGDTITVTATVLETRRSKSKPDRGLVQSLWQVQNQRGELVLSMRGWGMFRTRASRDPANPE